MAFKFDLDSQSKAEKKAPSRLPIGKFTLFAIISFGLLVTVLLAWHPLATAANTAMARRNALEAQAATAEKDWVKAHEELTLARKRAPEDVGVIMAMVAFYKATGSDPGGLAQQLALLGQQRPLTDEEFLLLGRSLITSGKTKDARKVYEKLPLAQSTQKSGLELLSSILSAEGHVKEAEEISQRAAAQSADTPEAHLQAAVADLNSHFGEVRIQAVKQLWQFAKLNTQTGLDAIHQLAANPDLTLPEARNLLALQEQHPLKTLPTRLEVLSALLRLQPDQRADLALAEIKRFQTSKNGRREDLAYWLMKENFNEQVFKLVPKDLAIQSRELYPILMQSMAQAQRWEELQALLKLQHPPVSKSLLDLAMAEVQSHLQPDFKETRRLLQGTVTNAKQEGSVSTLHIAAVLAEKLNLADIACQAYEAAGNLAADSNLNDEALLNLQKSAELALRTKDATSLLEISRRLHQLSPSSAVFADRLIYLRLLLGIEMETVNSSSLLSQAELHAALAITLERIPPQMLLALAAYRLGNLEVMQQHLAALKNTDNLAAGPRAVIAGLLSLAGKGDRAYQMAEKIPTALLLDEELSFLKRAL